MQFCVHLWDLVFDILGVLIPGRRMFPPRNIMLVLMNGKLSFSLAILGLLMLLDPRKRRGSLSWLSERNGIVAGQ